MKLYYHEISSNSHKTCALAKHLGLDADYVSVDVTAGQQHSPEFLAINPNGKIPVLVDGDRIVWESNAILCHLAGAAGSDLWPSDEAGRIDVMRWLIWEQAHFTRHAGALFFENVIKPRLGRGETNPETVAEATEFLNRFAGVLNGHLKGRSHLVGDRLTVAEFSVGSVVPLAALGGVPLDGYAEIVRWYAQLDALPAWQNPWPETAAKLAA